jgi:ribose-phosphate pyrophosphokinase
MKIIKYPDNSSYARIEDNFLNLEFTYRINSYEDLWHLGQIIEVYNHNNLKPIVTIPNLIDAQADRRFDKAQTFGLGLVARWLNQFEVEKYKIFHPHNQEVVEALIKNVEIIDNTNFIKVVLSKIDNDNLVLMSSDAGGFKPLMKLCDKISWKGEVFSASKSRSWDEIDGTKFIQQIDRSDFGGKDILIIDDLSIYGGTFKGLSKLLRGKNVGKIYLAVSHMTIQNMGDDSLLNYYDKVYCTNSKYDIYFGSDLLEYEDLEVIKMF